MQPIRLLVTTTVPAKRPASAEDALQSGADTTRPAQGQSRHSFIAPAPSEQPQSRRGSLALPPLQPAPSSDVPQLVRPAPKKRPTLNRSRTTSNDSEAGSPAPSDTEGRSKGLKRSGSGAPRRKVIESRLEKSIRQGVPPQFCFHCGAIETPTWRRLYIKHCEGKPTGLDSHEGEGETIGVEVTERDQTTGDATSFVIRKSMKRTKENAPGVDFESVQVCNPCGLWFNKFRVMRPPDKWNRKATFRKSKKQRDNGEAGPATDGLEPQSEAFYTDQVGHDDVADADITEPATQQDNAALESMPPPLHKPRASSLQPEEQRLNLGAGLTASQLNAAVSRVVQSSPVRSSQGSQHAPI